MKRFLLSLFFLLLAFPTEAQLTSCPNGTLTTNLLWCKRAAPDAALSRQDTWDLLTEVDTLSATTTHNLFSATHTDTVAGSPVLGDIIYGNATPKWAKLVGNTTTAKQFFSQTGTGTVSAAPVWVALTDADVPDTITLTNLTQVTNRAFSDTTGTVLEGRGGTGQTTYALGDTLYASATNILAKLAGNTTSTKKFLGQTGTGSVSAAPGWFQTDFADLSGAATDAQVPDTITLSNLTQITTRSHASLTGLTVDDHTQYLLASGARGLAADWPAGDTRRIQIGKVWARTDPIYHASAYASAQAAIDAACAAAGGGLVFLPPELTLTSTLNVDCPSGTPVIGIVGAPSRILCSTGASACLAIVTRDTIAFTKIADITLAKSGTVKEVGSIGLKVTPSQSTSGIGIIVVSNFRTHVFETGISMTAVDTPAARGVGNVLMNNYRSESEGRAFLFNGAQVSKFSNVYINAPEIGILVDNTFNNASLPSAGLQFSNLNIQNPVTGRGIQMKGFGNGGSDISVSGMACGKCGDFAGGYGIDLDSSGGGNMILTVSDVELEAKNTIIRIGRDAHLHMSNLLALTSCGGNVANEAILIDGSQGEIDVHFDNGGINAGCDTNTRNLINITSATNTASQVRITLDGVWLRGSTGAGSNTIRADSTKLRMYANNSQFWARPNIISAPASVIITGSVCGTGESLVGGNLSNVVVAASPSCKENPAVRAWHSVGQGVSSQVVTFLAFDSENFDTDTMHDLVTNNSRITFTTAGKYQITGCVEWDSNATGLRELFVEKNALTRIADDLRNNSGGTFSTRECLSTTVYSFAAGDYVRLGVFQDSGSTLNVTRVSDTSPLFSAVRIAD